jgi:cysteinyl-tRNA synthetase, unknown class
MPRLTAGWSAVSALAALFALAWPYRDIPAQSVAIARTPRPLAAVQTWRYQLDKIDVAELARDPSDLLVIDYAKKDGKVPLSPDDVARLKVRPGGRPRFVVAYLSVGESEEFRFYWDPKWTAPAREPLPDWIGEENCAWPKAHRVRYWSDGWKQINFRSPDSYLRRIIEAGFDGVYLDRVDIYETFEKERPTARQDMVDHVAELAATARRLKPGFFVIPQNAEALLPVARYRLVIDGLGKESLLHGASETGRRNTPADIRWSLGMLSHLLNEGKPVFAVEYLIDAGQIDVTAREMRRRRLVPAFETRALDGQDPTKPVDLKTEIGTPERTTKQCPPGTSW